MSQQSLHGLTITTILHCSTRNVMLRCRSAFVVVDPIGRRAQTLGDGSQGLDMPRLFLHIHEYQRTYRSRKTICGSSVIIIPHLLKHSGNVPKDSAGNVACLNVLDVSESAGSRVGLHDTSANRQAACSSL